MSEANLFDESKQSHPDVVTEPLSQPIGHSANTGSVLALIERLAVNPEVDVEKLERVLAMQERLLAHDAEQQFNSAKARIKKQLANYRIVKRKSVLYDIDKNDKRKGQATAFKYAPLEDIDKVLAPLLAEESMDLSYSLEPREGGGALIRGRLKHLPSGHFEDSTMPLPLDTTGGKSNVQAMGSTNSYGRRYVACNMFNIVVIDDDDDGTGGTIDVGQVRRIKELIENLSKLDATKDETGFCKFMRVEAIEDIAFRDYRKATSALEERIAKLEAENA